MNRSYSRGPARADREQNTGDKHLLQTVDRALQVLEQFTAARPEWTLTELSRTLSLHKTVVFRILGSLAARGFLVHDPISKRYHVGSKVMGLSGAFMANIDICRVARPFIKELAEQTRESVILGIRSGDEAVCVDKVDSPESVKLVFHVGERASLHRGPSKLVLAHLPPAEVEAYFKRLAGSTEKFDGETSPAALEAELEQIRRDDYVYSEGEVVAGGAAVAVPVFDYQGNVAAVLTVAGPKARVEPKRNQILVDLRATTKQISGQMGFAGTFKR